MAVIREQQPRRPAAGVNIMLDQSGHLATETVGGWQCRLCGPRRANGPTIATAATNGRIDLHGVTGADDGAGWTDIKAA